MQLCQVSLSFTISCSLLKSSLLSQGCYPAISSSVIPFSSCPQSFPASVSFLISQLFSSGGQSIEASASVLPMTIQGCFPLGLTGLISLPSESSPAPQIGSISSSTEYSGLISLRIDWLDLLEVQGTLKGLLHSPAPQFEKINSSVLNFLYSPTLISIHDSGKTIDLTRQTFVGKVMSLLYNMLSSLVIAFLPRSKQLLIFMTAVTIYSDFGAQKIKSVTVSIVSPSICHEVMDQMSWS